MTREPQDGGEKIYEWDAVENGDRSPEFVYEVTAETIADYCKGVRYENPVYLNDATAREMGFPGVFAPPTMLYTYRAPAPQRPHRGARIHRTRAVRRRAQEHPLRIHRRPLPGDSGPPPAT